MDPAASIPACDLVTGDTLQRPSDECAIEMNLFCSHQSIERRAATWGSKERMMLATLAAVALAVATMPVAVSSERMIIPFRYGWRFHYGPGPDDGA